MNSKRTQSHGDVSVDCGEVNNLSGEAIVYNHSGYHGNGMRDAEPTTERSRYQLLALVLEVLHMSVQEKQGR